MLTAEEMLKRRGTGAASTGSSAVKPASQPGFQPYQPEDKNQALIDKFNEDLNKKEEKSGLKSWLSGGINVLADVGEGMKELVAGSTGRAVGGLITTGIGSGMSLAGQFSGDEELQEKGERVKKEGKKGIGVGSVAGTVLELWPGGKEASLALSKLPQGKKLIVGLENALKYVPEKLKESAITQYMKALGPTTKEQKIITEKIAPELLERGTKFSSAEKLEQFAVPKMKEAGDKIGTMFEKMPDNQWTNVSPVVERLDKLAETYKVSTAAGTDKVVRESAVNAIDNVKQAILDISKVSETGEPEAGMKSIRKLRQIFDEHYDVSKGIDDISAYTKKAERAAGDSIREILSQANPDLQKLNAEYALWRNVVDLAGEKALKEVGKETPGLLSRGAGAIVGSGLGTAVFGPGVGTAVGAFAGEEAVRLFKSPAYRTLSADLKNKLADALASGNTFVAANIIARMAKSVPNLVKSKGEQE